jgi:FMN reductase
MCAERNTDCSGPERLGAPTGREMPMSSNERPLIVGIGGTPRVHSTTERALAVALKAAAAEGAETEMISGPDLILPMYDPSKAERTEGARRLIELFRRANGIVIASPAYHGSLSGLMKNALDYAEDLRDNERVYFDGVAVGLIACAGGWQAAGQTLAALRAVAHALRGWPTPLGATLNTSTKLFDKDGQCIDLSSRFQLETVGQQVVEFSRMRRAIVGMNRSLV